MAMQTSVSPMFLFTLLAGSLALVAIVVATRVSRWLHVSAATLLGLLGIIVIGAIIDIIQNGTSGYPNFWREVRSPLGYLIVFLLLTHGATLGAMRQLKMSSFIWSHVLILAWLILEPLWPRT